MPKGNCMVTLVQTCTTTCSSLKLETHFYLLAQLYIFVYFNSIIIQTIQRAYMYVTSKSGNRVGWVGDFLEG